MVHSVSNSRNTKTRLNMTDNDPIRVTRINQASADQQSAPDLDETDTQALCVDCQRINMVCPGHPLFPDLCVQDDPE